MSHIIRDFIADDRLDYIRFSQQFYCSEAVAHPVGAENFGKTFDACIAGNPYLRGFMLLNAGEPAGYALISLTWSNEAGGLSVILDELFIAEECRGAHFGTTAIKHIEEEYTGKAKRIRLEVTKENAGAMRLYERLGYEYLAYLQMVKELWGQHNSSQTP